MTECFTAYGSDLLIWAVLVPLGLGLAVIDLRTHTLPTRLIAPGYLWVIAVIVVAAVVEGDFTKVGSAAAGWALMGGFYLALWWFRATGMGYGDVRLAGLLGLALGHLGLKSAVVGLYLPFLLGGVWALALLARHRRNQAFAFGPFLIAGALIAALWGESLL